MADANVASRMSQVAVQLYKVTKLPHGCIGRTHYSWTLKQADREGAISLDEAGLITSINEENLKFDLPKNMELEDILHPDLLISMESSKHDAK